MQTWFRKVSFSICILFSLSAELCGQVAEDLEAAAFDRIDIRSNTNLHFEIVGFDQRSVSYIDRLSKYLGEVCSVYLPVPEGGYPQRILISLRPKEFVDFEGLYHINPRGRGFVDLDLLWDEKLKLEQTCLAITEAYAIRHSIYTGGPSSIRTVKAWPVSAIGTISYLSLRPAQLVSFTWDGQLQKFPPLENVLTRLGDESESAILTRGGYWFLMALREVGFDRNIQADFLQRGLAGENVLNTLGSMLPKNEATGEAFGILDWWDSMETILLVDPFERYETLKESRVWISELVDFSTYKEEFGDFKNLRSLWAQREDPALRDVLIARSQLIRLKLERVNPAYFNVGRSLGSLFETVIHGKEIHEFIGSLTAFLTDYEDIKKTHAKVESELDLL